MGAAEGVASSKETESSLFPLADDLATVLAISDAGVGDAGVEESDQVASC